MANWKKPWTEEIVYHIENNFVLKLSQKGERTFYNFLKYDDDNGWFRCEYEHYNKINLKKFREFAKKSKKKMPAVFPDDDGELLIAWKNYLIRMERKEKLKKLLDK